MSPFFSFPPTKYLKLRGMLATQLMIEKSVIPSVSNASVLLVVVCKTLKNEFTKLIKQLIKENFSLLKNTVKKSEMIVISNLAVVP